MDDIHAKGFQGVEGFSMSGGHSFWSLKSTQIGGGIALVGLVALLSNHGDESDVRSYNCTFIDGAPSARTERTSVTDQTETLSINLEGQRNCGQFSQRFTRAAGAAAGATPSDPPEHGTGEWTKASESFFRANGEELDAEEVRNELFWDVSKRSSSAEIAAGLGGLFTIVGLGIMMDPVLPDGLQPIASFDRGSYSYGFSYRASENVKLGITQDEDATRASFQLRW